MVDFICRIVSLQYRIVSLICHIAGPPEGFADAPDGIAGLRCRVVSLICDIADVADNIADVLGGSASLLYRITGRQWRWGLAAGQGAASLRRGRW